MHVLRLTNRNVVVLAINTYVRNDARCGDRRQSTASSDRYLLASFAKADHSCHSQNESAR